MPRKILQGTVEEQAGQLYDMAVEAMAEGRYSAAYRYLREIERALPGFRDVPELLDKAAHAKREQRWLAMGAMGMAIALIVLARVLGVSSEWIFLGASALGLVLGAVVGLVLFRLVVGPYQGPDQE